MPPASRQPVPDIDLRDAPRYRPLPDPSVSLTSPILKRLYAYWRAKAAMRPPTRADIDPLEIGPDIRHVVLLDVALDPLRFRWRLLGGELVDSIGRNVSGKSFEEVYPHPLYADVMRVFSRVALTGLPVRHVGTARFANRGHLRYESLHLPLFGDNGEVAMMFGGLHFQQLDTAS
ncbi:PAS domain-containing protein [Thalassobaculum sp.]|uniref:PAS domain-containing protein n=1 Tax=Thalassobaculum sp. TaxID=2022740 RepID=UPI0032EC79AE